jgi:pyocin large subunit-like protein
MNAKDPRRNQPTEEGRNHDPNLRDESAIQPGVNTISSSDYDDDNEELTKTAEDDFRTEDDFDPNADPSFDEIDEE